MSWVNSAESVHNFTNASGNPATMVVPPNGFGPGTVTASSGFMPNFAKIGYLDGDVLSDPRYADIVNAEIERLGIKGGTASLHKHLGASVSKARQEGLLKRFSFIYGVPGAGKSTIMMGGRPGAGGSKRNPRTPILRESDISNLDEVIDTRASIDGTIEALRSGGYLSNVDRATILSSSTKAEQERVVKRRHARDAKIRAGISDTAFGRPAGTSLGASPDSSVVEAAAAYHLGDRAKFYGIEDNFKLKKKSGPSVTEKRLGILFGAMSPSTVGHLSTRSAANEMGIGNEDFMAVLSKEGGGAIDRNDPHSYRTAIFTRKLRAELAKLTFEGSSVVTSSAQTPMGALSFMKTGDNQFVKPGPGSTIFLGTDDNKEKSAEGYRKMGFDVNFVKRGEGVSGTSLRDAIFSGDTATIRQLAAPKAAERLIELMPQIQNRQQAMSAIFDRVDGKFSGEFETIQGQLSAYPARMTAKYKQENPESYQKVLDLRAQEAEIKKKMKSLPGKYLRRLAGMNPKKYGEFSKGFVPNFANVSNSNAMPEKTRLFNFDGPASQLPSKSKSSYKKWIADKNSRVEMNDRLNFGVLLKSSGKTGGKIPENKKDMWRRGAVHEGALEPEMAKKSLISTSKSAFGVMPESELGTMMRAITSPYSRNPNDKNFSEKWANHSELLSGNAPTDFISKRKFLHAKSLAQKIISGKLTEEAAAKKYFRDKVNTPTDYAEVKSGFTASNLLNGRGTDDSKYQFNLLDNLYKKSLAINMPRAMMGGFKEADPSPYKIDKVSFGTLETEAEDFARNKIASSGFIPNFASPLPQVDLDRITDPSNDLFHLSVRPTIFDDELAGLRNNTGGIKSRLLLKEESGEGLINRLNIDTKRYNISPFDSSGRPLFLIASLEMQEQMNQVREMILKNLSGFTGGNNYGRFLKGSGKDIVSSEMQEFLMADYMGLKDAVYSNKGLDFTAEDMPKVREKVRSIGKVYFPDGRQLTPSELDEYIPKLIQGDAKSSSLTTNKETAIRRLAPDFIKALKDPKLASQYVGYRPKSRSSGFIPNFASGNSKFGPNGFNLIRKFIRSNNKYKGWSGFSGKNVDLFRGVPSDATGDIFSPKSEYDPRAFKYGVEEAMENVAWGKKSFLVPSSPDVEVAREFAMNSSGRIGKISQPTSRIMNKDGYLDFLGSTGLKEGNSFIHKLVELSAKDQLRKPVGFSTYDFVNHEGFATEQEVALASLRGRFAGFTPNFASSDNRFPVSMGSDGIAKIGMLMSDGPGYMKDFLKHLQGLKGVKGIDAGSIINKKISAKGLEKLAKIMGVPVTGYAAESFLSSLSENKRAGFSNMGKRDIFGGINFKAMRKASGFIPNFADFSRGISKDEMRSLIKAYKNNTNHHSSGEEWGGTFVGAYNEFGTGMSEKMAAAYAKRNDRKKPGYIIRGNNSQARVNENSYLGWNEHLFKDGISTNDLTSFSSLSRDGFAANKSMNLKKFMDRYLRRYGKGLSSGFVPNFASNYFDGVANLESSMSGNRATFHANSPAGPHFRNAGQGFATAMVQHGGLSRAMKDSRRNQSAAGLIASRGFVPNFADGGSEYDMPADSTASASSNLTTNFAALSGVVGSLMFSLQFLAQGMQGAGAEFKDIREKVKSSGKTLEENLTGKKGKLSKADLNDIDRRARITMDNESRAMAKSAKRVDVIQRNIDEKRAYTPKSAAEKKSKQDSIRKSALAIKNEGIRQQQISDNIVNAQDNLSMTNYARSRGLAGIGKKLGNNALMAGMVTQGLAGVGSQMVGGEGSVGGSLFGALGNAAGFAGTGFMMGATAGSGGGPIGAAIGAAVGLAISAPQVAEALSGKEGVAKAAAKSSERFQKVTESLSTVLSSKQRVNDAEKSGAASESQLSKMRKDLDKNIKSLPIAYQKALRKESTLTGMIEAAEKIRVNEEQNDKFAQLDTIRLAAKNEVGNWASRLSGGIIRAGSGKTREYAAGVATLGNGFGGGFKGTDKEVEGKFQELSKMRGRLAIGKMNAFNADGFFRNTEGMAEIRKAFADQGLEYYAKGFGGSVEIINGEMEMKGGTEEQRSAFTKMRKNFELSGNDPKQVQAMIDELEKSFSNERQAFKMDQKRKAEIKKLPKDKQLLFDGLETISIFAESIGELKRFKASTDLDVADNLSNAVFSISREMLPGFSKTTSDYFENLQKAQETLLDSQASSQYKLAEMSTIDSLRGGDGPLSALLGNIKDAATTEMDSTEKEQLLSLISQGNDVTTKKGFDDFIASVDAFSKTGPKNKIEVAQGLRDKASADFAKSEGKVTIASAAEKAKSNMALEVQKVSSTIQSALSLGGGLQSSIYSTVQSSNAYRNQSELVAGMISSQEYAGRSAFDLALRFKELGMAIPQDVANSAISADKYKTRQSTALDIVAAEKAGIKLSSEQQKALFDKGDAMSAFRSKFDLNEFKSRDEVARALRTVNPNIKGDALAKIQDGYQNGLSYDQAVGSPDMAPINNAIKAAGVSIESGGKALGAALSGALKTILDNMSAPAVQKTPDGMTMPPQTNSSGFIPNFASGIIAERMGAKAHGYASGTPYMTRVHDGLGGSSMSWVNSAETVQTVMGGNGHLGTYVIPPNGFANGGYSSGKIPAPNNSALVLVDNPIKKDKKYQEKLIKDYYDMLFKRYAKDGKLPIDKMLLFLNQIESGALGSNLLKYRKFNPNKSITFEKGKNKQMLGMAEADYKAYHTKQFDKTTQEYVGNNYTLNAYKADSDEFQKNIRHDERGQIIGNKAAMDADLNSKYKTLTWDNLSNDFVQNNAFLDWINSAIYKDWAANNPSGKWYSARRNYQSAFGQYRGISQDPEDIKKAMEERMATAEKDYYEDQKAIKEWRVKIAEWEKATGKKYQEEMPSQQVTADDGIDMGFTWKRNSDNYAISKTDLEKKFKSPMSEEKRILSSTYPELPMSKIISSIALGYHDKLGGHFVYNTIQEPNGASDILNNSRTAAAGRIPIFANTGRPDNNQKTPPSNNTNNVEVNMAPVFNLGDTTINAPEGSTKDDSGLTEKIQEVISSEIDSLKNMVESKVADIRQKVEAIVMDVAAGATR
jgi:hypothetical protein